MEGEGRRRNAGVIYGRDRPRRPPGHLQSHAQSPAPSPKPPNLLASPKRHRPKSPLARQLAPQHRRSNPPLHLPTYRCRLHANQPSRSVHLAPRLDLVARAPPTRGGRSQRRSHLTARKGTRDGATGPVSAAASWVGGIWWGCVQEIRTARVVCRLERGWGEDTTVPMRSLIAGSRLRSRREEQTLRRINGSNRLVGGGLKRRRERR